MKPPLTRSPVLRWVIGLFLRKGLLLKIGIFLGVITSLILFFCNRSLLNGPGLSGAGQAGLVSRAPLVFQNEFWRESAVSFIEVLVAFLITILSVLVLFSLSSLSRSVRSFLSSFMTIWGIMPLVALIGVINILFNDFWTITFLAASTLIARCSDPVLKITPLIPPLLLKSAEALRLKPWQKFWKLDVPVAYPAMIRAVTLEMPHFWIRLLGAEWLLSLLNPAVQHGLGGHVFLYLQRRDFFGVCDVLFVIVLLIAFIHIFCLKPFLKRVHRFDLSPCLTQNAHLEKCERSTKFLGKHVVVTLLFLSLSCAFLLHGPSHFALMSTSALKGLLIWGSSLGAALLAWIIIGGLTLRAAPFLRAKARSCAYVSQSLPLFLLCPLVSSLWEEILLFFLIIQGAYGASVFYRDEDGVRNDLLNVAYRLHLSGFQIWRHVKLLLLVPSLARGTMLASYPLWDLLILGGSMIAAGGALQGSGGLGQLFLDALQGGDFALQTGLFFMIAAFSYGLTYMVLSPLSAQAYRKFRMHP